MCAERVERQESNPGIVPQGRKEMCWQKGPQEKSQKA